MANKIIGISINLVLLAFFGFVGWLFIKPAESLPFCDEIAQPRPVGQSVRCKYRKVDAKPVKLSKSDKKLVSDIMNNAKKELGYK